MPNYICYYYFIICITMIIHSVYLLGLYALFKCVLWLYGIIHMHVLNANNKEFDILSIWSTHMGHGQPRGFLHLLILIITYSDHLLDVMANIIILKKCLNILKKCYIIYYAYGIIKVKYLEILRTILFVHLLFLFYNDYNIKIYLILSYNLLKFTSIIVLYL